MYISDSYSFSFIEINQLRIKRNYIEINLDISKITNNINLYELLNKGLEVKILINFELYEKENRIYEDDFDFATIYNINLKYDAINKGYLISYGFISDLKEEWYSDITNAIEKTLNTGNIILFGTEKLKDKKLYYLKIYGDAKSLEIAFPINILFGIFGIGNIRSPVKRTKYFDKYSIYE